MVIPTQISWARTLPCSSGTDRLLITTVGTEQNRVHSQRAPKKKKGSLDSR